MENDARVAAGPASEPAAHGAKPASKTPAEAQVRLMRQCTSMLRERIWTGTYSRPPPPSLRPRPEDPVDAMGPALEQALASLTHESSGCAATSPCAACSTLSRAERPPAEAGPSVDAGPGHAGVWRDAAVDPGLLRAAQAVSTGQPSSFPSPLPPTHTLSSPLLCAHCTRCLPCARGYRARPGSASSSSSDSPPSASRSSRAAPDGDGDAARSPQKPEADGMQRVLVNEDLLAAIFRRFGVADAAAALLTCKTWAKVIQVLGRGAYNPEADSLLVDHCQKPLRLCEGTSRYSDLGLWVGTSTHVPSTLAAVTSLRFMEALPPASIARVISQTGVLRELVCRCSLGEAGTRTLGHRLAALMRLTLLDLEGSRLGCRGAAALAPSLRQLQSLRELRLGDNRLLELRPLADAVQPLRGLVRLSLSYNRLTWQSVRALEDAPGALLRLRDLNLRHNMLQPPGAHRLAAVLPRMTCLTKVMLCCNALGAEGAGALAPVLQGLPRLLELHLAGNVMGSDAAAGLLANWSRQRPLAYLDLQDNGVSVEQKVLLKHLAFSSGGVQRLEV